MSHRAAQRLIVSSLAALAIVVIAAPATAADGPWTLRLRGAWIDGDIDYSQVDEDDVRVTADAESAFGFGLDLEYRLNDRFGVAGGALWSQPDVKVRATAPTGESVSASGDIRFMPITAGLAIHLTPDAPVDVVFTPAVAWISYGDLEISNPQLGSERIDIDNDLTWSASLGVDWAASDSIVLNAAVSYFDTDIEGSNDGDSETLSFDPFVYSVGVGFRF